MYLFRQEEYPQLSGFARSPYTHHPSDLKKKEMALAAIGGESVSQIARRFGVSRKCVYAQKIRALKAVEDEFIEKSQDQEKVLFTANFTNSLVTRLVLAMFLCGKSSYRATQRIFEDVFGYHISLGKLSSIITDASRAAAKINASYDMSQISIACHDEFFHDNRPYVVAVEPLSRFCFLLETATKPLEELWITALKRLAELGYAPNYVTADGGYSLRSALEQVLPETPCYYDVFHLIRYFGQAILAIKRDRGFYEVYISNCQTRIKQAAEKGFDATDAVVALQQNEISIAEVNANIVRVKRCIGRMLNKTTNPDRSFSAEERLASYEKTQDAIFELCSFYSGLETKSRRPLLNIVSLLHGQKKNILGLYAIPSEVPMVRASSMVENFNYVLREQTQRFSHLDEKIKDLAHFYINHQRFLISKNPDRQGKSPAELFLNKEMPGWLDLLLES